MKHTARHRLALVLMVLNQCVPLGLLSGLWVFPALAAVVAIGGLWPRLHFSVPPQRFRYAVWALAGVFLLKLFVTLDSFYHVPVVFPYHYGYAIAGFALSVQILQIYRREKDGRPRAFVPFLGVLVLVLAAKRYVPLYSEHLILRIATGIHLILTVWYIRMRPPTASKHQERGSRIMLLTAMLVLLVCVLGWLGGIGTVKLEAKVIEVLRDATWPSATEKVTAGFDHNAWLGSVRHWKRVDEGKVTLRVISKGMPGYLKARVFEQLALRGHANWQAPTHYEVVRPLKDRPSGLPPLPESDMLFHIRNGDISDRNWTTLEVHLDNILDQVLFTTPNAQLLSAGLANLHKGGYGVLTTVRKPIDKRYTLLVPDKSPKTPEPSTVTLETLLEVPPELDPRVYALAEEIFEDTTSVAEKTHAVTRFLATNNRYQLGVVYRDKPEETDLVSYFLLDQPPGHCEYFATSAAVLLRIAGVPARYVTGFVCVERNPWGDYWIARNRDAHAWVEAWDGENHEWRRVDATPAEGIPGQDYKQPSTWAQLSDGLDFLMVRLRAALREGVFRKYGQKLAEIAKGALHYLATEVGVALGLALALTLAWVLVRVHRVGGAAGENAIETQAQKLVFELDQRVARRLATRNENETLHQFADRLTRETQPPLEDWAKEAARWYRTYAALRYDGRLDAASLENLRDDLPR